MKLRMESPISLSQLASCEIYAGSMRGIYDNGTSHLNDFFIDNQPIALGMQSGQTQ